MIRRQQYVSDELTHFVGKGHANEYGQYKLLAKIIDSGWLTHPPHEDTDKNSGGLILSSSEKLSDNSMYSPEVICFCDIPSEDMGLHIKKYSPFGFAFSKSFLIEKGINPVFYIARGSKVKYFPKDDEPNNFSKINRSEFFDNMIENYRDLTRELMIYFKDLFYQSTEVIGSTESQVKIRKFQSRVMELEKFLDFHIFSYFKFFDSSKSEEDPDNYYMEREWRMLGSLHFSITDVRRIYLPKHYSQMFHKDIPAYDGQLTFV